MICLASRYRTAGSWICAAICAAALNAVLLDLLPGLMDRIPAKPAIMTPVPLANIVRVKRSEPPAQRKELPQKKEEKMPEKPQIRKKPVSRPKAVQELLTLPFEVKPELPVGPITVPVIPLETVAIDAPSFKPFYRMEEIDSGLTPMVKVPPVYPLRAKRRGIEGRVTVHFIVNEQGRVQDIEIVAAEPENVFEQSVIQCVSAWRFAPGKVAGVPVKTRVETTFRFEVK